MEMRWALTSACEWDGDWDGDKDGMESCLGWCLYILALMSLSLSLSKVRWALTSEHMVRMEKSLFLLCP